MTRRHDCHDPTSPATCPCRPPIAPERTLSAAQWGMASFLLSEVAFFSTLIVTYVAFLGRDIVGPTPAEALSLPLVIVTTLCLLSSSVTIHCGRTVARARTSSDCSASCWRRRSRSASRSWCGTAVEWHDLITEAPADDQPQPVRHHVLHAGRLPRPARDRRRRRDADRARPVARPRGDRSSIAPASSWSPGTGTSSTPSGLSCSSWSTSPAGVAEHESTNPHSTNDRRLGRDAQADRRAAGAGPRHRAAGDGRGDEPGVSCRRRHRVRRRAGHVDRAAAAGPRPRARAARRAGAAPAAGRRPRPARSSDCGAACPAIACGCR